MDNFLKLATNRNSLKSLVKDFYTDELKKIPPKYRLISLDGATHEWTGRGIAPKAFQ
jgi:hypothetical protein